MATYYLDFEGGSDAADGTTFANRWKTITSGATAARIAPGDTIRCMQSIGPNSLGIAGTWTQQSNTVTLASALNALITDCETAWTASASVTCSKDTTYWRTGTGSALQNISAGFTTGKVAYFGLGSAQDYSGYQGITLWVNVRTSALAASTLSIRLCSDTIGNTTVDTLALPAISIVDCWTPVYIDKGSALGASIQSIALYADADPGTILVYLDNISTVKAASGGDNLNLRSLIGKNTGNELWWCLREINGTSLTIDGTPYNDFGSNQRTGRGYYGTTESVTTYHRDTIPLPQTLSTSQSVQDSGTSGNLITFSGGWDRTNMSTQTGETWIDGSGAKGIGIHLNSQNYVHFDKFGVSRWDYGWWMQAGTTGGYTFGTIRSAHCRTAGMSLRTGKIKGATELSMNGGTAAFGGNLSVTELTATTIRSVSIGLNLGNQNGLDFGSSTNIKATTVEVSNAEEFGYSDNVSSQIANVDITNMNIDRCGSFSFVPLGTYANVYIGAITITNPDTNQTPFSLASMSPGSREIYYKTVNATATGATTTANLGTQEGVEVVIGSLTTQGGGIAGVAVGGLGGRCHVLKSTINETTKLSLSSSSELNKGYTAFRNFNGTSGDHRTYWGGGAMASIFSESSVRHTASGLAWKISPLSALVTERNPIRHVLAVVNVNASALVTLKLWMRRTNTNLTGVLRVRGGQLDGVPNDVTASISAAVDTWQEQTITFTPTVAGAVEVEVLTYTTDGVTTYSLYIDDFTPTQA